MQTPLFAVAKGARDLIDRFTAGRKQSLHGRFGRGLQVERPAHVGPSGIRGQGCHQRIEMPFSNHFGRHERRFHFEESPRIKETPQAAE